MQSITLKLITCCSTNPPIFPLAVTKAATSSSMSLSKSSTERGSGSGVGGLASGVDVDAATTAPVAGPSPFVTADGPSTDVAMSSSLDVAASSL